MPHVKARFAEHPNDIELETINPVNNYCSFFLHIIVKKRNHKWINKCVHFDCGSTALGSKWITKIQQFLKGKLLQPFIVNSQGKPTEISCSGAMRNFGSKCQRL